VTRKPIVVAGAGAAGILASLFAARAGRAVVLLERTKDGGRKILISGGGRCNILPSTVQPERFVTASSPNSLRNILRSWPLDEQRAFFERELGMPLVLEPETGKLFPESNKARDVRDRLLERVREAGGVIRFDATVEGVTPPGVPGAPWSIRLKDARALEASAVVLAMGGLSVPKTGSDGIGLRIARELGHTIHPTYPALTPLTADPLAHADLAGISLTVTIRAPGTKPRMETRGGFLFTHRGYSGPAVLDISHLATRAASGANRPLLVQWTDRDRAAWDAALQSGRKRVSSLLAEAMPARLAERLLVEAGIDAGTTVAHLDRKTRKRLVTLLVEYPLPWTGDEGFKKAEVTGGGVALDQVDPRTMESRRHLGLYLCGEMLDAFGPIGGHNFLWAWVTGRAAGRAAGSTDR
jgi:predicted Rossmann fold flavoprotein